MPTTKHMKKTIGHPLTEEESATPLRKHEPKASGTRIGVLHHWRQGSTSDKAERRHGQILRDGR